MSSLFKNSNLVFRVSTALTYISVTSAQCYFPGGAWASDQYPCDKYAYTTLCCPTGWTCFSNNLCIATDPSVVSSDLPLGTAIRGTCTNPQWNDTVCGDFCLNDPVSSNNGSIVPCGDNKWCCQPDVADGMCDCSSDRGTFQVSDGTAQTIIGVVGLDYTSTESVSHSSAAQSSSVTDVFSKLSTTSSSTVASSSTSSPSSSHPTFSSVASSSTSINSATTKSTGSDSSASPTDQQILGTSTPLTSTTAFKAGIGTTAGVVFAVLIGVAIWRLIARQRKRRQTRQVLIGNGSGMASRWDNPAPSEIPFQMSPNPNPYEDQGFAGGGSRSASRAALAEQVAHNRTTTQRPRIIFEDGGQGGNPYGDGYMGGGGGR